MWRPVGLLQTDVSEERVTSIFRAEEITRASTLKMEATRSFETSVYNKPTQHHNPEHGILHNHSRENLKFYIPWTGLGLCPLMNSGYSYFDSSLVCRSVRCYFHSSVAPYSYRSSMQLGPKKETV
jgi:hypothetical protein